MATLEQLELAADVLGVDRSTMRRYITDARRRGPTLTQAEQYDEALRWLKREHQAGALAQARKSVGLDY